MNKTLVLTASALIALNLTACATSSSNAPAASDSPTQESSASVNGESMYTPIVILENDLHDGATYAVPMQSALVIRPEDSPETWVEGSVANTDIVTFSPGRYDGSAWFSPSFEPVSAGKTSAQITNPATNTTISFTITVTD